MWLKVSTTVLIIFSIAMLFAYFWIVGPKPPSSAPRPEQVAFLRRGAAYIGIEALALIGSIVGSYLIARRAREEYRELSRRNMDSLLEATLRDHAQAKGHDADGD